MYNVHADFNIILHVESKKHEHCHIKYQYVKRSSYLTLYLTFSQKTWSLVKDLQLLDVSLCIWYRRNFVEMSETFLSETFFGNISSKFQRNFEEMLRWKHSSETCTVLPRYYMHSDSVLLVFSR